jgi:hypothetical protein
MNKEKILTKLLNMIKMKVLFFLLITIMSVSLYGQEKNGRFSQNAVDYSNLSDSSFLKSYFWDANTKEAFGVFQNSTLVYVKSKVSENLELTIKFIVNDPLNEISETFEMEWRDRLITLSKPFLNKIDIELITNSKIYFDNANNEFSIFPSSTNYTFFEIYGIQPNLQTALIEIHLLKTL